MSHTTDPHRTPPIDGPEPLIDTTTHRLAHGITLPGRTQRALEEPMAVTLSQKGGVYQVRKQDNSTYLVDVVNGTCTCPDPHDHDKHQRRVERELELDRVPTIGGSIP